MDSRVDSFEIAGRQVGTTAPLFVMAEIGLNHDGSLDRALTLVDEAARAGAQAIKLQSLYADRLVAASCPPPLHVDVSSLRDLFARYELDEAAHAAIAAARPPPRSRLHLHALRARRRRHARPPRRRRLQDRERRPHASRADRARGEDRQAAHHLDRHEHDAATSPTRSRARARRARRHDRAAALRVGVSGARRSAESRRDSHARRHVRRAGRPVRSQRATGDGSLADRGRARRVDLRASSQAGERRRVLDEAVSSNSTELAAAIAAAARAKRAIGHGRREPQAGGDRQPDAQPPRALRGARPRARRHREGGRHHRAAARRRAVGCALRGARRHHACRGRSRRGRRSSTPTCHSEDRGRFVARLNVLITAASRRVALVQAFQRALRRPGISGQGARHRRQSAVARGPHRRPRVPRAVRRRARLPRRDPRGLRSQRRRLDHPDDRRRAAAVRGAPRACSKPPASASRSRTRAPPTTCNDKYATCETLRAAGVSAVETWLPDDAAGVARAAALHQAARRPRRRAGVPGRRNQDELQFFLRYVKDPVLQRYLSGPEFTLDLLCDFKRQAALGRAARARRHPLRRDRSRRHLERSRADPARARLRARVRRSPAPSTSSAASSTACRRCSRSTRGFRAASR